MILRRCYRPSVGLDIISVCRPHRSIDEGQTIVRSPDIRGLLYGPVNRAVSEARVPWTGPAYSNHFHVCGSPISGPNDKNSMGVPRVGVHNHAYIIV